MDHLVVIDGHHLMYRAYWAIPRTLSTKSGEQVNAVFGMASMLLSILRAEEPTHMVVCFDAGSDTFRHQENETYKEGRAETPDDFIAQIPRIIRLVETFGLSMESHPGFEADDLLCTYALQAEKAGMRVTIVTGDRDAFQLATDRVRIAIPHSGYAQAEYLGPAEIIAKYGIRPDQVPAYKGLTGDPSDNLPGVKGIGPKTAAQLLQTYDTLENLYDHLGEIRPAVRAKLEADREQAFFCRHMALLICDVPLSVPLSGTRLADLPADAILAIFRELEFSLLSRRFTDFLRTPFASRTFLRVADVFAPVTASVPPDTQQSLF